MVSIIWFNLVQEITIHNGKSTIHYGKVGGLRQVMAGEILNKGGSSQTQIYEGYFYLVSGWIRPCTTNVLAFRLA